jgi:hypothetical protein
MNLVDLFYNYSLWFALLAIVLIIVGLVVLASGNSVGWVHLLCGLVIGGALWGIVRKHANPIPNQTSQEIEDLKQRQNYQAWVEAVQNASDRHLPAPEYNKHFITAEEYTHGPRGAYWAELAHQAQATHDARVKGATPEILTDQEIQIHKLQSRLYY